MTLHKNTFLGLTKFVHLDLTISRIQSLDKDNFADLVSLNYLRLRQNNLTYLDETIFKTLHKDLFTHQTEMTDLRLAYNKLSSLPPDIFRNIAKLEMLKLSDIYLGFQNRFSCT